MMIFRIGNNINNNTKWWYKRKNKFLMSFEKKEQKKNYNDYKIVEDESCGQK